MAKRRSRELERMPGSSVERPPGMATYVVLLKENEDGDEIDQGRHAVYQAAVARNAAFQERLRKFLKKEGVADQVAAIGEPTSFPLVTLQATAEVAKRIAQLPEVQDVVRDTDGIESLSTRSQWD